MNLPGVPLPIPALTRKDLDDLEFALELGVDYVALSFVRSAADVRDLPPPDRGGGLDRHVIAKIEKSEAVDALDDILAETHAVMVARGDLGVEIGAGDGAADPEADHRARARLGVPVITATQMLESMIHRPSRRAPRRATSRTRSSTARRRSCSRARPRSASTRSRRSR